jgi:hypothetical protein
MALYYCKDGFPFIAGPYTEEDRQEFEERLRRGGDITIIRQRKPVRPELSIERLRDEANGKWSPDDD